MRFYTVDKDDIGIIAKRFGMSEEAVKTVLRRARVPIRRAAGAPLKPGAAPHQRSSASGPPARKDAYPLGLSPPPEKTWCAQCERLVHAREAETCGSRFCRAKARAA